MIGDIIVQNYHNAPMAAKQAFNALKPVFDELPGVDCWIAGGVVRDLCMTGAHATDIDILFPNSAEVSKAQPLVLGITRVGITNVVRAAESKLLLKNSFVYKYQTPLGQIDLLRRTFPGPAETVDSFDFTVCAAAVDRQGTFYCHHRFWQDLQARKLVCHTLSHPLSTMRRLQKYTQKGFSICNGGILTLARAIQATDLSKQEVFYVD